LSGSEASVVAIPLRWNLLDFEVEEPTRHPRMQLAGRELLVNLETAHEAEPDLV
jgi:hypothetical protein